jgi:NitT/TauT family transport system substrate-binding protein
MTSRGKFVLTLLILVLVGVGTYKWSDRLGLAPMSPLLLVEPGSSGLAAAEAKAFSSSLIVPQTAVPRLDSALAYQPKDNTIDIELSQYSGYAGLLVANDGLDPSENSVFFRKYGFKVRLKLSEEESWAALNAGRMAASATTTDVLAVYGGTLQVTVPAQIGYSRGADGIVVRSDIRRINDLKGRILITSQFTEADFFLRYLAQEAGLGVEMMADLASPPSPDKVNVVYATDAFAAGDLFLKDLESGANLLAGCITWAPKTTEVVGASKGTAALLATNTNLLIVADVLIVNKGFADANPALVTGLVAGLLEGNRAVRDHQADHLGLIARSFKWTPDQARAELAKVHLANLPENLAFFSGAIDAAGSFSGIYESAMLAYGPELIKNAPDPERLVDLRTLHALEASGDFAGQTIAIGPIRSSARSALEGDPLLSKDIRFLFEPNSSKLDLSQSYNMTNLDAIKHLLQVSPGSTILLRGHVSVEPARIEDFRRQGQEYYRRQVLWAMQLSKDRAIEIRDLLVNRLNVDPGRLETVGRGWEEPAGTNVDQNRRVEVQWFTVE